MIGSTPQNLLEPSALCDHFIRYPPEGFAARWLEAEGAKFPVFSTPFELLTTLDEDAKSTFERIPCARALARRLLRPRTVFAGTTVSEFAPYPQLEDYASLVAALLSEMKSSNARLAIVKDIPHETPLLSASENAAADRLVAACRSSGFTILEGQALAYVPIDFESESGYLARLSGTRRKDLRRKLRHRAEISIEALATGDASLADRGLSATLYALYENVFAQSDIHFDKLTRPFFEAVFRDADTNGVVFLYRAADKLIGWNLCYVCGGNLIDKYIGLVYPEARDASIYFVSWFHNLEFARQRGLKYYIAGWTDPKVKASLGARFTFTRHAVYLRNPLLRWILTRCRRYFESDRNLGQRAEAIES